MKFHGLVAVGLLATAACSSGSGSGSSAGSGSSSGSESTIPADGGDTWDSFGQGFFSKYCVECHAPGNSMGLDFTQHSIVTANKDTIRCGVCVVQQPTWECPAFPPAEQFPISDSSHSNPKPSDAERNYVVGWIEAGCP